MTTRSGSERRRRTDVPKTSLHASEYRIFRRYAGELSDSAYLIRAALECPPLTRCDALRERRDVLVESGWGLKDCIQKLDHGRLPPELLIQIELCLERIEQVATQLYNAVADLPTAPGTTTRRKSSEEVVVTARALPAENAVISEKARAAGLTKKDYLRSAALRTPQAVNPQLLRRTLADCGRVNGLIHLLTSQLEQGRLPRSVMERIERARSILRVAHRAIVERLS